MRELFVICCKVSGINAALIKLFSIRGRLSDIKSALRKRCILLVKIIRYSGYLTWLGQRLCYQPFFILDFSVFAICFWVFCVLLCFFFLRHSRWNPKQLRPFYIAVCKRGGCEWLGGLVGCGNKPAAKKRRSKGAAGVVLGQCMLAESGRG